MNTINKLTFIIIIMTTLFAFDGMSIGYDGSKFKSATFHNDQMVYGLDFLHANLSEEIENCDYGDYYDYCESTEESLTINIFMPRIGYKMPGPSSGKINTYNQIEAYMVLPLVSIDVGGSGDADEDEEFIEDLVDVMGVKFSKIIQYNFNEQLSLMAHVGFNLTFGDVDNDQVDSAIGGRLGITYTQLSLKFNL